MSKQAQQGKGNDSRAVRVLEKLLARKLQLKAELAELGRAHRKLGKRIESFAVRYAREPERLRESEDFHFKEQCFLEKREAELQGELTEINGLLRSIPARRLKPKVNEERVRKLVLDAGFVRSIGSLELFEAFREAHGSCWTSCEVCITSCNSECITSCTECVTSCQSGCVQCPTECVTLCTYGCSTVCTMSPGTMGMYRIPPTLDRGERQPEPEVMEKMVKTRHRDLKRIRIDWE